MGLRDQFNKLIEKTGLTDVKLPTIPKIPMPPIFSIPDSITVPVPLMVIKKLLSKQLPKVTGLKVVIENDFLVITGNIFIIIPFRIVLRPTETYDRKIVFDIVQFSPFNFEFIKRRTFRGSSMCHYANNTLTIDFDSIELLKKVPVLKLAGIELGTTSIKFKLGK